MSRSTYDFEIPKDGDWHEVGDSSKWTTLEDPYYYLYANPKTVVHIRLGDTKPTAQYGHRLTQYAVEEQSIIWVKVVQTITTDTASISSHTIIITE
jgi:hypothetical protein